MVGRKPKTVQAALKPFARILNSLELVRSVNLQREAEQLKIAEVAEANALVHRHEANQARKLIDNLSAFLAD